jgi:hypothetical protein
MTRSHPLDHHHPLNNPNHPSIFSPKPKKKKKKPLWYILFSNIDQEIVISYKILKQSSCCC